MRQFLLPKSYNQESKIEIKGKEYHYIKNVLKRQVGDHFPGRDYNGQLWDLELISYLPHSCILYCRKSEAKVDQIKTPKTRITLFQCIAKGKKMDQIIRQATEAGVERIFPIESEFSVVKEKKLKENKFLRWEKIIKEALQQSGGKTIPTLSTPIPLENIKDIWDLNQLGLVFHQEPLEKNSLHKYLSETPSEIGIFIGPEGGFSDNEIQFLKEIGFYSIYLGENVLRTETAAIYAIGAVKTILSENKEWRFLKQKE
jgi:16S rRNA (uracil1498-N3)-methyltransferase